MDLLDTEDVVPRDGGGVSNQENTAVPLRHEEVRRILTGYWTKVPTAQQEGRTVKGEDMNKY